MRLHWLRRGPADARAAVVGLRRPRRRGLPAGPRPAGPPLRRASTTVAASTSEKDGQPEHDEDRREWLDTQRRWHIEVFVQRRRLRASGADPGPRLRAGDPGSAHPVRALGAGVGVPCAGLVPRIARSAPEQCRQVPGRRVSSAAKCPVGAWGVPGSARSARGGRRRRGRGTRWSPRWPVTPAAGISCRSAPPSGAGHGVGLAVAADQEPDRAGAVERRRRSG